MTLLEIAAEIDAIIARLTTARTYLASLRPLPDLPLANAAASAPEKRRRGRPRKLPTTAENVSSPMSELKSTSPAKSAASAKAAAAGQSTVAANPAPAAKTATIAEPTAAANPVAAAPRPRNRRSSSIPESSALSAKVPTGPVAVPASAIPQRAPRAVAPKPAPPAPASGHSLEDLVRELRHRQPSPVSLEA